MGPLDLASLGITRVGDHTDLDVIGIPVWFASRPNSRGLSVSQGKGLTHARAKLSAVMEAVETAYAERCETLVRGRASLNELEAGGREAISFARMLRCASEEIDRDRPRFWVDGQRWRSGETVYAPYELVGIDYRQVSPWDHGTFHMSSIGLAAHIEPKRATLHALLEAIENDATAALDVFGYSEHLIEAVPELNQTPGLAQALDALTAAGMRAGFVRLRSAIDLPVIGCFVGRDVADARRSGTAVSAGFACRLQAEDAALAALLEAVQSRLTNIAGARDDIELSAFAPVGGTLVEDLPVTRLVKTPAKPDRTAGQALNAVMRSLEATGIEDIAVFELSDAPGLSVMRVLVPDLQSPAQSGQLRMGLTATRQLLG
jgi:ribosomal protein S12 methylthiotransferase accessory factor